MSAPPATVPAVSDPRPRSSGHWAAVIVLLVVAWLFVLLGAVGVYLHRTIYDEQVFSKRVTAVLEQPGVQAAVATELTDAIVKEVPTAVVDPGVVAVPAVEQTTPTLKESDVTVSTNPSPDDVPTAEDATQDDVIPQAYPEERYLTMWDKNPFLLKTAVIEQKTESFAKDWALSGISATGGVYTVIP